MSEIRLPDGAEGLQGISLVLPLPSRIGVIITCGIWAWGFNFYYLSNLRIDVSSLIRYASRQGSGLPHYQRVFRLAWTATVLQVVSLIIFWLVTRGHRESVLKWDLLPLLSLLLLVILFVLPLQRLSKNGRYRFLTTLKRISIGGIAEAQDGKFGDILLADALTSYARVLGDLVATLCMFLTPGKSANGVPDRGCGSELLIPLVISIPSMIRFRQCLIEFGRVKRSSNRLSGWGGQHLANALKYFTAFPVIVFSALQRNLDHVQLGVSEATLSKLWLIAVTINSLYSFYWDVAKDWDLTLLSSARSNGAHPWGLRRRLHFAPCAVYYIAIGGDLALRLTWASRLAPGLNKINNFEGGVFLIQSLEVFRRWIWIFFRVETEWVRSQYPAEDIVLLGDYESPGEF